MNKTMCVVCYSILVSGQHLLDVGCGPGTITVGLADRVGRVTAFDTESDVLEVAKSNSVGREDVHFLEASVYEIPFDDNTFDVSFCHQVNGICFAPRIRSFPSHE
jgi:ubiquinone/menaquinone biosynthesis C-methylase UbiE